MSGQLWAMVPMLLLMPWLWFLTSKRWETMSKRIRRALREEGL